MKTGDIAERTRSAIDNQTFVKLTLGAYRGREEDLLNLHIRLVKIRNEPMLSFVTHFKKRDVTKNYVISEGLSRIRNACSRDFQSAHLFTTAGNLQWQRDDKGRERFKQLPATITTAPETFHDRPKTKMLAPATTSRWLSLLGITTQQGELKTGMAGKLRQIERFAEILSHAIPAGKRERFRVADMGSGKGYLTFATYEFLSKLGIERLEVQGVELRPDLVSLCNRAANEADFTGLKFVEGEILQFPPGPLDLLIALHACDTATDDALYHGIQAGAEWIFVAPCCHKELRPQIKPPTAVEDILRYGIFLERHAEMLTDSLRALLLESQGYRTRVFEFVSSDHTGRNIMIAAQRDSVVRTKEAKERYERLRDSFGIQTQRLEQRLNGN